MVVDFGYLSRLPNPFGPGTLLAVAGCTGKGTRACLELLASGRMHAVATRLINADVVEVPVRIDLRDNGIELLDADGPTP